MVPQSTDFRCERTRQKQYAPPRRGIKRKSDIMTSDFRCLIRVVPEETTWSLQWEGGSCFIAHWIACWRLLAGSILTETLTLRNDAVNVQCSVVPILNPRFICCEIDYDHKLPKTANPSGFRKNVIFKSCFNEWKIATEVLLYMDTYSSEYWCVVQL